MELSILQIEAFEAVRNRLSPQGRDRIDAVSVEALEPARVAGFHWNFDLPSHAVDQVLGVDDDDQRRALIATWALEMPVRIEAEALPPEIMELYPYWLDQLAAFLVEATGEYDTDHWAKDVRFALVLSVPATRTQTLDLSFPLGPGEIVRHALQGRGGSPVIAYLKAGGWGRKWLQTHTESRHLEAFNVEGWTRMWVVGAALCRSRPEMAGVLGSSWLLDPVLASVSPRLAYMRAIPLKGGAFAVHQGPDPLHTDRAALKSPTRREMIAAGTYLPRSWLVAWPRASLMKWARDALETSSNTVG